MYTQVLRFNVCLHYASICLRITKRKFAQYDANKSISQGFTFIFIFILYVYIVVIWKISSDSSYTIETQSKRKYPRISSFSYGTKEVASIVRDTVNTYDGSDHTRHTLVIYLFMLLHNLFDDESEENIEDTVKINDTMRNDWRSLVPTITIYVAKESFFSNFMMPATFTQPSVGLCISTCFCVNALRKLEIRILSSHILEIFNFRNCLCSSRNAHNISLLNAGSSLETLWNLSRVMNVQLKIIID